MVNPANPDGSGDRLSSIPPVIAAYLTLDIQNSPDWAQELADQIDAVRQGKLDYWERLGNAYELVLTPDGATIVETVGPDEGNSVQVELEDLAIAVHTWMSASQDKGNSV
ncbi:MAG: YacL family protein [Cyanophyceae cyanobacterium]